MNDFLLVVRTLFDNSWKMLSINVPGFNFTFADVLIGMIMIVIALNLLRLFVGLPYSVSGISTGRSAPNSNNNYKQNPKTSPERMNDEK